MTQLTKHRGPWRVSATVFDSGEARPMVVEFDPYNLTVRQHGRRKGYSLPWAAVYVIAAQAEADRLRREKRAGRKRR